MGFIRDLASVGTPGPRLLPYRAGGVSRAVRRRVENHVTHIVTLVQLVITLLGTAHEPSASKTDKP